MRSKKTLKPTTNEPATLEFGYKTFNTIHRNLEKPATKILLQCSHLVRFFRTLVRIRTFFKKLVRKWSGFALKSPDLTKNGRINAENWSFSSGIQRRRFFLKLKTSRIVKEVWNKSYLMVMVRIWQIQVRIWSGSALKSCLNLVLFWSILVLFEKW